VLSAILSSDDNPGLIGLFARGRRRIERHDDALQDRQMLSPALVQLLPVPERAGHVFGHLSQQLLPAKSGSLVFANDLVEETRCEVCAIFISRAAGHNDIAALA
jgi:hypothetical protein